MAIRITERPKSREVKFESNGGASRTDTYVIQGASDSSEALKSLINEAPSSVSVNGIACGAPSYDVKPEANPTDPVVSVYYGTVSYSAASGVPKPSGGGGSDPQQPQTPEDRSVISFDVTSTPETLLNSYTTTIHRTSGFEDKLNGWPINQHHPELPPEGVEINTRAVTFSINSLVYASVATDAWWFARLNQVWTRNQDNFLAFGFGMVMLTGITGELMKSGYWRVGMNFEYRQNRPPVTYPTVKGPITLGMTNGWDYVWAEYNTLTVDDDNPDTPDTVRREVTDVHVCEIYKTSDFTQLPIVF